MSCVAAVLLCAAAAVAVGVCAQSGGGAVQMSVLYSGGKWSVVAGVNQQQGVAWGSFADTLNSTGWGVLNIETNSAFADAQQMYAAGYLESALTHARIYESALNMRATFFGSTTAQPPAALAQWFAQNEQWVNAQVKANPTDRNWQHIGLIKAQFDGEVDGYMASAGAGQALARLDLQVVNGVGDLLDLLNVVEPQRMRDWTSLSKADFDLMVYRRSLCSALVKVTGDYSELFAGHSAWFTYAAMNRIYKYYTFAVSTAPAAQSMGFSSYPGMLESLDDFYTMSSGLTMVQTTISNFNQSLYAAVTPHSLLAWYRVRLANWLSRTGDEWYANFAPYNSGTYNNEYMVVNYNLFTPGQPLQPGTLWVVEQMPTLCVGDDLTDILAQGYWPSYNVPFFASIYNLSGWAAAAEQYGTDYTWELAPRAQIFRRDQGAVVDMPSFQALMRYNDYTADPYSAGDPMKAICSRGDLASPPNFGGCYDTKVTDSKLAPALAAFALNGPTQSNGLPAFAWTAANTGMASHLGEPAVYDFDFQPMTPATFGPNGRAHTARSAHQQRRAHNHKRH